jgi:hypothetical protein
MEVSDGLFKALAVGGHAVGLLTKVLLERERTKRWERPVDRRK